MLDAGSGIKLYLIRVILHGQLPVGMFDLSLIGCPLKTEKLVEIPTLFLTCHHLTILNLSEDSTFKY